MVGNALRNRAAARRRQHALSDRGKETSSRYGVRLCQPWQTLRDTGWYKLALLLRASAEGPIGAGPKLWEQTRWDQACGGAHPASWCCRERMCSSPGCPPSAAPAHAWGGHDVAARARRVTQEVCCMTQTLRNQPAHCNAPHPLQLWLSQVQPWLLVQRSPAAACCLTRGRTFFGFLAATMPGWEGGVRACVWWWWMGWMCGWRGVGGCLAEVAGAFACALAVEQVPKQLPVTPTLRKAPGPDAHQQATQPAAALAPRPTNWHDQPNGASPAPLWPVQQASA